MIAPPLKMATKSKNQRAATRTYAGWTGWLQEENGARFPVLDAKVGETSISFDTTGIDGSEYTVVLHPAPAAGSDRWRGTWRYKENRITGSVDARGYRTGEEGRLALVGHWVEDGETYTWITELIRS